MDAILALSSKGKVVIPTQLRQLLGLKPGDRLALSLKPDGLRLCSGYHGPTVSLEQMDPVLFARRPEHP